MIFLAASEIEGISHDIQSVRLCRCRGDRGRPHPGRLELEIRTRSQQAMPGYLPVTYEPCDKRRGKSNRTQWSDGEAGLDNQSVVTAGASRLVTTARIGL